MDESVLHVWLVEDDALYRQALVDLIDGQADVRFVAAFASCEAALEALQHAHIPEVILMDIGLPGLSGTEGARRLKAVSPATQIVMLTIHEDEDRIFEALCAGASGYLLKNVPGERIVQAIREAHSGGLPFTPAIAQKVLHLFRHTAPPPDRYGLTEREREILQLLADGLTQRRMAERLYLSPHTIDTHLRNIYAKLHVRNGFAAISKATRERLI